MKSVIKDIYYKKNTNAETVKMGEEYWENLKKINESYALIVKTLPDEKKAEFKKLCDLYVENEADSSESSFVEGVKLGILLGIEAYN